MPWSRKKTGLAVSAALAGTSANIAQAQIEEIIVTATKRAESAQDVPISVQAVAGDDLRELRVETFDRYEVGVKSDLPDRSLRLNATWFRSFIDELQVSRFDPSNVAFLFFIENIGDAESSGLDVDFLWLPTGSLSIAGAFSVLDTELTRINPQLNGIAAPVGSELPMAPAGAGCPPIPASSTRSPRR